MSTTSSLNNMLINVLKNQYSLYLKTQNYHWNVEGIQFLTLHHLFESQYQEIATLIDTTAEHIRSLGTKIPASFDFFASPPIISAGNERFNQQEMLNDLIKSHQQIEQVLKTFLKESEKMDDFVVSDYLTDCLTFHRKAVWFLSSHL